MSILTIIPIASEKAYATSLSNVYAFKVPMTANKQQIIAAVEAQYGVSVKDVRTLIQNGKTSEVAAFIKKNKLDVRRILLVPDVKTTEIVRATNNISSLEVSSPTYLTVFHILNADKIVISAKALPKIEAWLKGDK